MLYDLAFSAPSGDPLNAQGNVTMGVMWQSPSDFGRIEVGNGGALIHWRIVMRRPNSLAPPNAMAGSFFVVTDTNGTTHASSMCNSANIDHSDGTSGVPDQRANGGHC